MAYYNEVIEMAQSTSLKQRITAAAAGESISNPEAWAGSNMWRLASSPGWGQLWNYKKVNLDVNQNPDLGIRTDVITDEAIFSAIAAINTPQPEGTE